MKSLSIIFFVFLFTSTLFAQKKAKMDMIPGKMIVDYAPSFYEGEERKIPEGYQSKIIAEWKEVSKKAIFSTQQSEAKAQIILTFQTTPPSNVKAIFEKAAETWSNLISSDVPIHVLVQWASLGKNILGRAGATAHVRNFIGATRLNTYYPIALAEKMAHTNLNGDSPDIVATFSQDYPSWYIGTGLPKLPSKPSSTDGEIDLYSVVLHEMGHGLGFIGQIDVDEAGTSAEYSAAEIFDQFITNTKGTSLTDTTVYKNPSTALKTQITTSQNLILSSPTINKNVPKKAYLYSPTTFNAGSSIYHVDQYTYPVGDPNALMTPFIAQGEITRSIGPIVSSAFADFGWKSTNIITQQYKDTEEIGKDFIFEAKVFSDTLIDESSFKLMIAVNSSITSAVAYTPKKIAANTYQVTLPKTSTSKTVSYYWTINDVAGNKYTTPAEAPIIAGTKWGSFYDVNIVEKDTAKPTVVYANPVKYIFPIELDVPLPTLYADDNIGVDTVYMEYSINNGSVIRQGLKKSLSEEFAYTNAFKFSQGQLKAGDIIKYRIVVKDKAKIPNYVYSPSTGNYDISVINLQSAVKEYSTTFNNGPFSDFYLKGFSISQASGLNSLSLNSAHPYADGAEDFENGTAGEDKFTNNDAVLLKPITVRSDTSKIYFKEIALVEPGDTGENFLNSDGTINRSFFDYVIVQGSKDFGKTWVNLSDGWDARKESIWLSTWNKSFDKLGNSTAKATPDLYKSHEIDIRESGYFKAGDQVILRFRLHADVGANGWGWSVEDLNIQGPKKTINDIILAKAEEPKEIGINLFPNPNAGEYRLELQFKDVSSKNALIFVRDIQGRELSLDQVEINNAYFEKNYSFQHLSNGIYFIEVQVNGQSYVRRMFIVK
ncbi:MAG: T9SS type A sorting domain-containing protein [Aquirufa sp.]